MRNIDFTKLTKHNIRVLQPYQAKEIPCKAKLDANESPYSIERPQDILSAKALKTLNRYPDPEAKELKSTIAKNFKVGSANILLGNGSDELIYYLTITFGGPVLYPVPTFSMYGIISQALDEMHVGIPLDRDFDLNVKEMLAAVKKYAPKLIFLSSPNNPSGNCFSFEKIQRLIEASKGIVVVDEAYQPFSKKGTFLPMLKDYENLAVLKTLSKIGYASLRVGFLLADERLISEVNKVRLPYNLNALSQAIALGAFKNKQLLRQKISAVISERERLLAEISAVEGVKPYPSDANFILFRVDDADRVFLGLERSGVLVRNMNSVIKNSLRVTIGTPEENALFIGALRKTMDKAPKVKTAKRRQL